MSAPRCEFCGADAVLGTGGGAFAEFLACAECAAESSEQARAAGDEPGPLWSRLDGAAPGTDEGARWDRCSYCDRPAASGLAVVRPEGRWPACDLCASLECSRGGPAAEVTCDLEW